MRLPAIKGGKPVRKQFLPLARPTIGSREKKEIISCLESGWLTTGPKNLQFEDKFRNYIGCKYAVSLDSCTAGLELSLVVNKIKEKDEVITTPFTFVSTVNVIIHQKAIPVLADIDPKTYNIDPGLIEKRITRRTKAIIPVHYAGQPCNMEEIRRLAGKYRLVVIEDAAHALGSEFHNKKIGSFGDITAFSFYPTKNITTAEGGMVTTNRKVWADKIRALRFHGIVDRKAWQRYSPQGNWYYDVNYAGYKNNLTDLQASLGLHQIDRLDHFNKKRTRIAKKYTEAFGKVEGIRVPFVNKGIKHAWHLYTILIDRKVTGIDRDRFAKALRAENIGTSVHFIPIYHHSFYKKMLKSYRKEFPNTEYVYNSIISIPIFPAMKEQDIENVITAIKRIVEYYKNKKRGKYVR